MYYIEKLIEQSKEVSSLSELAEKARQDLVNSERERLRDSEYEYWQTVEIIAKEALDEDDPDDFIHEAVDGNYWVIYTHANLKVLQYTRNDSAADDADLSGGWFKALPAIAYYCMQADVMEKYAELALEKAEQDDVYSIEEDDND